MKKKLFNRERETQRLVKGSGWNEEGREVRWKNYTVVLEPEAKRLMTEMPRIKTEMATSD